MNKEHTEIKLTFKPIRYDENGKRLKSGKRNKKYIRMVQSLIGEIPEEFLNKLCKYGITYCKRR